MKKSKVIEIIKEVINEGYENTNQLNLIDRAIEDGHIGEYEGSAPYIMSAIKKITTKWNLLHPEEQKVMRDEYYKFFLKLINK